MEIEIKNTRELFEKVRSENLYKNLISQLNKDFNYARIDVIFPATIDSQQLVDELHEILYQLINKKFTDYLYLLYLVDVSEKEIKGLDGADVLNLAKEVAFLVLKREWQKVWYKEQYKG